MVPRNPFSITLITLPLLAAVLISLPLRGQPPPSASGGKVIHEAPPLLVPPDPAAGRTQPPPTPVGLQIDDAFVIGGNVLLLDAPTQAQIQRIAEEAQQRARAAGIEPGPPRVGIVRTIEPGLLASPDGLVEQTVLPDGRLLWTLGVVSQGAFGLRLHLRDMDLGRGEMRIYGFDGEGLIVRGPFTGRGPHGSGEMWTALLPGEMALIEVVGSDAPHFELSELVHFDVKFWDDGPTGRADGGTNGNGVFPCHLDAMCASVNDAARRATGQMNFVVGGADYVCTGTMLNDLDPDTLVPYFLSANHCLDTQSAVNTLEVVWLWQRDSCGGNLPDYYTLPRSLGGTLIDHSSDNDFVFIRLAGSVPGGTALAGWTTETSVSNAFGVHHPGGSWKRAVMLDPVGVCPGCVCLDSAYFDYYNMTDGLVEGGSSGSGVFNPSGQLAGQLYGRCSDTTDPADMDCNNVDAFWAVYGEFEETYPVIRIWLERGGTIHVDWTNTTPPWEGTPSNPYPTVGLGYAAAWNGADIKIRTGSYNETLIMNKQLTLIADGGLVVIGR